MREPDIGLVPFPRACSLLGISLEAVSKWGIKSLKIGEELYKALPSSFSDRESESIFATFLTLPPKSLALYTALCEPQSAMEVNKAGPLSPFLFPHFPELLTTGLRRAFLLSVSSGKNLLERTIAIFNPL